MVTSIFSIMDDLKSNFWMKIGILAILVNVFTGIFKLIFISVNIVLPNEIFTILNQILEGLSFGLLILFGISILIYSNEIQNQNGMLAGITFLIKNVIAYLYVYLYPFYIMNILYYANGLILLTMLAAFLFFLIKISEKYEEPIILIAVIAMIAVAVVNAIFLYISPIITTSALIIRDFLLYWAFNVIITEHERGKQKEKKKDFDYKHVKVKYEE